MRSAHILHDFPPAPRKKAKIYKNFISLQLASSGWMGHLALSESIFIVRNSMDAIYLLILVALYGATHALVWAFERLGKTR